MSISGGGGNDDFFLKIRVFLKTSHPYLSKKKKICKTNDKCRSYGQKYFIQKSAKNEIQYRTMYNCYYILRIG